MKNLILIIITFIFLFACNKKQKDAGFRVEVVELNNTHYGYLIKLEDKVFVRQDIIPAVSGKKVFCDSLDALSIGNIVVERMNAYESPVLTVEDIEKSGIKLNCNK